MTIEEAIEILDLDTSREALDRYEYYGGFGGRRAVLEAVNEACQVACAALRAQLEAEKNEPLTLAELREMDGEPVWIAGVSSVNNFKGHWDICDWENGEVVSFPYCAETPCINDYGITWLAYRRKPEGGDDNA